MDARVLLVEPDEEIARRVVEAVETAGLGTVTVERDPRTARSLPGEVDCAVVGHDPPALDGIAAVDELQRDGADLPVVFYPRRGSETVASAAITAGVDEYVERRGEGEGIDRLVATVEDVLAGDDGPPGGLPVTVRAETDGGSEARATIPDPVDVPEEIPFDLKERAMDEAPVGITISDPSLPDNPLIYVNDAFERMTGYTREEALGTNCRFLQGDETDHAPVQAMREAVESDEPVSVELVNYTKDGDLFWNKVDIAPLENEDGEVTNYVGFQTDITERKRAEFAVERYAERLDAERAALERILDRVNGLIGESTETLVGATSRTGIAREVCELIADTDPYAGAWLGELDLAADAVVPTAGAGLDDPDLTDRRIDVDGADPAAVAVSTGEVQTVSDLASVEGEAAWHAGVAPDATSLAVVPLTYRDTKYGALAVYARDPTAVDERERTVLGALGRMIATAINAVETKEILTADNVVSLTLEVDDDDLFFVGVARELDCTLEHVGSVSRDDGSMLTFFTAEDADPEAVLSAARAHQEVESATLMTESDGVGLFEFAVGDRSIFAELADFGATTHELAVEDGVARFRVETPHDSAARSIVSSLEGRYDGVELVAYREHERPPTTKNEYITTLRDRLTERQLTALQKAYVAGYYEWPRRTDGDELAGTMDISRTTFHQHLRAAQRKLVEEFFADG